jgi:hypothetical protein
MLPRIGTVPDELNASLGGRPLRARPLACRAGLAQLFSVECFACAAAVELASGERVGFRDSCDACGADLHVCRNCTHHDPAAYNECREPNAERVSDRERANRCDYFAPTERAAGPGANRGGKARDALDALFKKP